MRSIQFEAETDLHFAAFNSRATVVAVHQRERASRLVVWRREGGEAIHS